MGYSTSRFTFVPYMTVHTWFSQSVRDSFHKWKVFILVSQSKWHQRLNCGRICSINVRLMWRRNDEILMKRMSRAGERRILKMNKFLTTIIIFVFRISTFTMWRVKSFFYTKRIKENFNVKSFSEFLVFSAFVRLLFKWIIMFEKFANNNAT